MLKQKALEEIVKHAFNRETSTAQYLKQAKPLSDLERLMGEQGNNLAFLHL